MDDASIWQAERARLLNDLADADRHWLPAYTTVLPPTLPPRYVVYRGKDFTLAAALAIREI
jgi:hypothetical protein